MIVGVVAAVAAMAIKYDPYVEWLRWFLVLYCLHIVCEGMAGDAVIAPATLTGRLAA